MKKRALQQLLFLIAVISLTIGSYSANSSRKVVRFVEKTKQASNSFVAQNLPKKINRMSANKGNIVLIYNENLPDSIKTSFEVARQIWESKLHNRQPIYIGIEFELLDSDVAMESYIVYSGEHFDYPASLMSQLSNFPYGNEESPDGLIVFNSKTKWNCSFTDNGVSRYNLATMALRGIARCLGFVSSIKEIKKDVFSFYNFWPTLFDQNLTNLNQKLSNIAMGSEAMTSFVKSDNVFFKTNSQYYGIYAPKTFNPNESLSYLKQENSIMSQSLGSGNIMLDIDNATVDILNSLGWDMPETGMNIECQDIGDNGIGSSYSSHTFSLAQSIQNISKYEWKFLLKIPSGTFEEISTGNSPLFTIEKVDIPDNYFININGDLEGRIECRYTTNGKETDAVPFSLSLELKPIITSIENVKVNRIDDYNFKVSLDAYYSGAEHIYLEIEEEDNSSLRNYRYNQPFFAHMSTGNISALYYSWVYVRVINDFGEAMETFEFAPTYTSVDYHEVPDGKNIIQVAGLDGKIVYEGRKESFVENSVPKGIYIERGQAENGDIKTTKRIIQ